MCKSQPYLGFITRSPGVVESKINIDSGKLVVNPQFADVENFVEKLNTYWVRNRSLRRSEHILSAIKPPSATPS